jgi:hypothetical protein
MTLAEVLSIPRSCSTTAAQNDEFRGTARLGQVMCTPGVLELGERFVAAALAAVRTDKPAPRIRLEPTMLDV